MAGVRDFKKLTVSDEGMNRVQEYINLALRPILASSIGNGVLLTNIELASGANEVEHKLGREPQGYLVVQKDANESVWDSQSTNTRKRIILSLNTSGACTVSLWVF